MSEKGRIRVIGSILQSPICETTEARIVEFYDQFGDMNALLVRIFDDDIWSLITDKDLDWSATLIRYGYINPSITTGQLLDDLKDKG